MPVVKHNPENLYPQYQNYSHAIEVSSGSRLLIISGLNGYLADGKSMSGSIWARSWSLRRWATRIWYP